MPDLREYVADDEDSFRLLVQGEMKKLYVAMPVIVDKTSDDGHSVKVKMAIKAQVRDENGKTSTVEYPTMDMAPIHFMGGGGVTMTHPAAEKDEGIAIFMSRPQDTWREKGDVQDPIDNRMFALSDARYLPGGRSDPRKIKNVSTKSAHLRSDDGKHTFEQHPEKGMTAKSVHPDDKEENPWEKSKKHHQVQIVGEVGFLNESVDKNNDKTHKHSLDYDNGHVIAANNDKHKTEIHPDKGVKSSADDGKHYADVKSGEGVTIAANDGEHSVAAKTDGVNIKSSAKVDIDAPQTNVTGNLGVAQVLTAAQGLFGSMGGAGGGSVGGNAPNSNAGAGGVGAGGIAQDGAANNVGDLGGDLEGLLPNPRVKIQSYLFAALPVGDVGHMAVITDAPAGLAWGDVVTAGGGPAAYLTWFNGVGYSVMGK